MNLVTPEFATTNRQLAAYIFTTKALKYRRTTTTDDDRNPVQWQFADPDGVGAKIAEGFHDGSAQVSARAYANALSKTHWAVKRLRDQPKSQPASASEERTAPSFEVPAEWMS